MQEWEEGMEAGGPLPLQTLEVRAAPRTARFPRATDAAPRRGTPPKVLAH